MANIVKQTEKQLYTDLVQLTFLLVLIDNYELDVYLITIS